MRRYYIAAAALLALYVAACSIERADARPLPAHKPAAAFGAAHCLPSGVWQATLAVTADVGGGTAHLAPQGVTGFDLPMPVSNVFSIGPNVATYTVTVTVRWSDGFVAAPISVTATRPADGCTVPTTSTTTCEQAIPPVADCGTATSEVTTSTTTASTTTSPSTSPPISPPISVDATSVAPSTSPPRSGSSASSSTLPLSLPTTGSSPVGPAGIAAGIALTGCALLLISARRRGVER